MLEKSLDDRVYLPSSSRASCEEGVGCNLEIQRRRSGNTSRVQAGLPELHFKVVKYDKTINKFDKEVVKICAI